MYFRACLNAKYVPNFGKIMTIPRVNLRKVNGSYMMDYTVNGKRTRKNIGTNKRLAESIVAAKQKDLTLGKFDLLPEEKNIISIEVLVEKFLAYHNARNAQSTVNRYKNHLLPYSSFITDYFNEISSDIRLIKPEYIEECIEYLIKDLKPKPWKPYTVNRSLQTLSSTFIFAMDREYLDKNPCIKVKKLKVPKKDDPDFFSKEELEEIWKTIDPFWVNFFKFLYNTGLRKGEIIHLKWDRVYLEKPPFKIKVINTDDWDPKTGSSVRNVPLNKSAMEIIERQKNINQEYVFVSKKGIKTHPNSPYIAIKRALKALNIDGDVHTFRHTFASHLAMKGANMYELKELLGHSTIEMTQKYAHLSPEHKESVVNLLELDD